MKKELERTINPNDLKPLLLSLEPILLKFATRLAVTANDRDDLMQEARMHLLELIDSYDPERGSFDYFAKIGMYRAMMRLVIDKKMDGRARSYIPMQIDTDDPAVLASEIELRYRKDPEEVLCLKEMIQKIHRKLLELTAEEKAVLTMKMGYSDSIPIEMDPAVIKRIKTNFSKLLYRLNKDATGQMISWQDFLEVLANYWNPSTIDL